LLTANIFLKTSTVSKTTLLSKGYVSILFQAKLESPTESEVSLPLPADPEEESRTSSSSITIKRLNSIPCACEGSPMPTATTVASPTTASAEARSVAESVLVDVLASMFEELATKSPADVQPSRQKAVRPSDIEIDCTQPEIEIRVSPRHRRSAPATTVRSESSDAADQHQRHQRAHHHHRSQESDSNATSWSKSENTTTRLKIQYILLFEGPSIS
jgi:hypothetical protein